MVQEHGYLIVNSIPRSQQNGHLAEKEAEEESWLEEGLLGDDRLVAAETGGGASRDETGCCRD